MHDSAEDADGARSAAAAARGLPARDWGAASLVVLIWAMNFIVGKVGLLELPPLLMMGLRFALVAVLLAPFLRWPGRNRWPLIGALAVVLGGLHFGLLFVGLSGVSAGPAAIAIQLAVPFSALLAAVFYRERLSVWQLAGMGVAFTGIWLLAGEPAHAPSPPHLLMVVIAAFSWAFANVLIKRLGRINVFALNGWVALLTAPLLLAASGLFEDGQLEAIAGADWRGWGAIVYMAVGASVIAYGLWYYLIEKHEMNRVVPMTLLAPVLAVFLAAWLLDEPLTPTLLVGGAVTLVGVAMIQFLRPVVPEPPVPT
jgi:O-acetylserine/cysteine efflux transporter